MLIKSEHFINFSTQKKKKKRKKVGASNKRQCKHLERVENKKETKRLFSNLKSA